MMPESMRRTLLCAVLLAAAPLCQAEKADRDKPVNIESDRATVDEISQVHIFDGNVTLTQGTLVISGDRLEVKQDAEGFKTGVATAKPGNLAHFRVKRDGREEYAEGEAERIEFDARSDVTKFINRAKVRSGQDEMRGQYILFDGVNESYSVTSGPAGSVVPGKENRVRAVIQPKGKAAPAPAQPAQTQNPPAGPNPKQE
jgi:lipopolysaccharide export system protein LptA